MGLIEARQRKEGTFEGREVAGDIEAIPQSF